MIDYGDRTHRWIGARWPGIRAKGMRHFVVVRGLLLFGGSMFAAMTAVALLKFGPQHPRLLLMLAMTAVVSAVGGLVWGLLTWTINERIFRNLDSNRRSA